MDHFVLTCTTCKSRLKVRDSGTIGQILACPKCGGMVLVKPTESPATQGPSAPSASDIGETRPDLSNPLRAVSPVSLNAPLMSDAFDDVDELLGNVPARTMVPTPTTRASAGHPPAAQPRMQAPIGTPPTVIRPNDAQKSPDSQAKTVSQENIPVQKQVAGKKPEPSTRAAAAFAPVAATAAATIAPPVAHAAALPVPIPSDVPATEPAAGPLAGGTWQFWAIVSGSGLLGVALAIGVVAVFMSWFSKPPIMVTPPVAIAPVEPGPANTNGANNVEGNGEQPPPANNTTVVPAPMPPVENPLANVKPAGPEQPPVVAPPEQPKPLPPMPAGDPLGLTEPVPPPVKPIEPAKDPLKQFDEILAGGNANPLPMPPDAPKPASPAPEEDPGPSATNTLPKPQPRHIDAAARLAESLPAIAINNTPLADFLQEMQNFCTVPITLRPDGLSMIKLTPFSAETPLTWQGKTTTVHEAIQAAVAPLGLEARLEADQLVVDVASPQMAMLRLNVKDLTGSDEARAGDLAALLQTLIAPDSWKDDETGPSIAVGKDELQIKQHRQALAECVLLAEKLRVARGLRPQTKFDAKLFELTTRQQKAAGALDASITLNYSQPTPVVRVVERLGKTANVRILIDWQALSFAGWNPDGEVTLTVEKQSLAKTLDDLTSRMELTWRVVDARTLQITSPLALAERTEFELYPVGNKFTDEAAAMAFVAKLRSALGNEHFRDAGGRGELRFDLAGKCLLSTLPQPQQKQLAALLAK